MSGNPGFGVAATLGATLVDDPDAAPAAAPGASPEWLQKLAAAQQGDTTVTPDAHANGSAADLGNNTGWMPTPTEPDPAKPAESSEGSASQAPASEDPAKKAESDDAEVTPAELSRWKRSWRFVLRILAHLKPGRKPKNADVPHRLLSWQFWLYTVSFHRKNPGVSHKEQLLNRKAWLEERIGEIKIKHWFVVTILSMIGGIGKTMVTAYLLRLFGLIRVNDRGVGVDINPDMGVFARRMGILANKMVSLMFVWNKREQLKTYSETKEAIPFRDGVAVVGAVDEGDEADADKIKKFYDEFDEAKYKAFESIFKPVTSGIFNDAGTGLLSTTINAAALGCTDVTVVVADHSVDAGDSARKAVRDLTAAGYKEMIANSVLVINRVKPEDDVSKLHAEFGTVYRQVLEVPWDLWMSNRDNPVNERKISLEAHVAMLEVLLAVLEGIVYEVETEKSPAEAPSGSPSPDDTKKSETP